MPETVVWKAWDTRQRRIMIPERCETNEGSIELSQLIAWREFPGHSTERESTQAKPGKLGELRIQSWRLRRPGQLEFSGENCTERGSFRGLHKVPTWVFSWRLISTYLKKLSEARESSQKARGNWLAHRAEKVSFSPARLENFKRHGWGWG